LIRDGGVDPTWRRVRNSRGRFRPVD
jgi:hypothetical protein